MNTIGVLALQGDFEAHRAALARVGAASREVRRPEELDEVSGLILPGGESTTLVKLIEDMGLEGPLRSFVRQGRPVLGTCAGAILLASQVEGRDQLCLGAIDIDVQRNAYGRQRESFEASSGILMPPSGGPEGGRAVEMVFIRAPRITRVGTKVTVLGVHRDEPVLVRQGGVLAATYHPEMGRDGTVHRLLVDLTRASAAA